MKIAFSTLGCPDWDWGDMITVAKDLGYDGIEVRGVGREMFMPDAKIFQPATIEQTKAKLKALNLEISCLTSAVRLNETFKIEQHIEEGKEYIDLAAKMQIPYVRMLGDTAPEPIGDLDIAEIAKGLKPLADYAKTKGVVILIETNGYFAKTQHMLELLNQTGSEAVKVLWDIHHPYRYYNEAVADTYKALKPYIAYLHIKDSAMENNAVEYKMMGYGDVPIKEVVEMLQADGFEGYLSLEWLKRWCHHLAEPGLIFPQYISYMKKIIK